MPRTLAFATLSLCALLSPVKNSVSTYAPPSPVVEVLEDIRPSNCLPADIHGFAPLPPNSAILLIDMQQYFIDRGRWETEGSVGISPREQKNLNRAYDEHTQRLIAAQQDVLAYANAQELPIALIEMTHMGPTLRALASIAEKNPRLKVFEKSDTVAFENPDLDEYLREQGVTNVFLMGGYARYCVRDTARRAQDLGYCVSTSEHVLTDYRDWWLDEKTRANILESYRLEGMLLRPDMGIPHNITSILWNR